MDDHPEDYITLTYEDWCELLSNIKVKYERKRPAGHIKKIVSARVASLIDSNKSAGVPRRNRAKAGVLNSHKYPRRAHGRNHGAHHYCELCKKAGIPDRKYMSHSTKDCTGGHTKCSIRDEMGGPIGSRTHAVKHHEKYEKKWKK